MPTIQPTAHDDAKDEQGYTLAELLVVITLLGILSTVTMTSYSRALGDIKLDATAREIQGALRYAQNQSLKFDVQSGGKYGVWFSVSGNWFQCIKNNGTPTPDGVVHPIDKKPFQVDFDNVGYLQGITLVSVSLDVNDQIFFDKRGTPSVAGSVTIRFAGEQRTVTVSSPTGMVTIN